MLVQHVNMFLLSSPLWACVGLVAVETRWVTTCPGRDGYQLKPWPHCWETRFSRLLPCYRAPFYTCFTGFSRWVVGVASPLCPSPWSLHLISSLCVSFSTALSTPTDSPTSWQLQPFSQLPLNSLPPAANNRQKLISYDYRGYKQIIFKPACLGLINILCIICRSRGVKEFRALLG